MKPEYPAKCDFPRLRSQPGVFHPRHVRRYRALGLEPLEQRCLLAAGALDPTFGTGGKVLTNVFEMRVDEFAYDVAVTQADHKVLVAGNAKTSYPERGFFVLARWNVDGSLDTTFGQAGKVTTSFGALDSEAWALAVQPDGKIIVAGSCVQNPPGGLSHRQMSEYDRAFAVARFQSNGNLDTSFGSGGLVITDFGIGADVARSVAVDSLGRIVVAGFSQPLGTADFAVARYHSDGSLDTAFGFAGRVTTDIAFGRYDFAQSVLVDASGRIVVAGCSSEDSRGTNSDFVVVRYDTNGALDSSFDADGKLTTDFASSSEEAADVALDSTGCIVVAGSAKLAGATGWDFAVARYTTGGSIDTSFDGDGRKTIDFGRSADEKAFSVATDVDGKIVMAGSIQYDQDAGPSELDDFALTRLNSDGSLDTTFHQDGLATLDLGYGRDEARSVAIDANRNVVVAGFSYRYGLGSDFALARFDSSGNLDASFDGDGMAGTNFLGDSSDESGVDSLVQPDGKIVVLANTEFSDGLILIRYNSDGTPDTSFGVAGQAIFSEDFGETVGSSVVLQPDGRLVVVGYTWTDFLVARLNSDGSADESFGSHGTVTTDFASGTDTARSVAIDADGKIVVLGSASDLSLNVDFALARYNSNGTLDTSFGVAGKLRTDFDSPEDEGQTVLIEPRGEIVVGGSSQQSTGSEFALARYTSNGILDPSFDSDGKVRISFGSQTSSYLAEIGRDPNGRIVAVGSTARSQGGVFRDISDFALARYNADGSLDSSFDTDGLVTTGFATDSDDLAASIAIQPSGKILVAGSSFQASTGWDFALAQFNVNGTLDGSFGSDGTVTTDFGATCDDGQSLIVDPSGKIVVAGGSLAAATGWDVALARYRSDGTLDPSFDSDGLLETNLLAFGTQDMTRMLAVQGDGKILVGGRLGDEYSYGLTLVRYTSDGSLDSSFGSGGKVVSSSSFQPDAAVIQADGKIVVVGSCDGRNSDSDFAVGRYQADGSIDTAFGNAGVVTVDFGSQFDYVAGVALAPDGKIVVVGSSAKPSSTHEIADFAVARLNPNGTLDTTFDGDGKVVTDFGANRDDLAASLAVDSDGRIVVVGSTTEYQDGELLQEADFALVRYLASGSLDVSFDGDGKVITDLSSNSEDDPTSVVFDANGRILVAGSSYRILFRPPYYVQDFALARYNHNGSLDTSLDGDGIVFADFAGADDYATSVAVDTVGKIVAAGFSCSDSCDFALARYTADGALDSSFDGDGKVTTDFGLEWDYSTSALIDSNGKILVAGMSYQETTGIDLAMARYLGVTRGPAVVSTAPSEPIAGPIAWLQFNFDLPMDQTSFSLADDLVSTAGPQGSFTVTGFRWVDFDTLELTFQPQWGLGVYSIVIGPRILSSEADAMDQDSDRNPGESPDDRYSGTFTITTGSWKNLALACDVTGDGNIVPIDALVIINELNHPKYHDQTGRLQLPPPTNMPPPYYDVNGDGFVSPMDALTIINYLNARPGGEGEEGRHDTNLTIPADSPGCRWWPPACIPALRPRDESRDCVPSGKGVLATDERSYYVFAGLRRPDSEEPGRMSPEPTDFHLHMPELESVLTDIAEDLSESWDDDMKSEVIA